MGFKRGDYLTIAFWEIIKTLGEINICKITSTVSGTIKTPNYHSVPATGAINTFTRHLTILDLPHDQSPLSAKKKES